MKELAEGATKGAVRAWARRARAGGNPSKTSQANSCERRSMKNWLRSLPKVPPRALARMGARARAGGNPAEASQANTYEWHSVRYAATPK